MTQPTFDPAALYQTINGLMVAVNELRTEINAVRTNVAEALDLVWQRTLGNEERCAKRFKASRLRLKTVEQRYKQLKERLFGAASSTAGALLDHVKQREQREQQPSFNVFDSTAMMSPVSLASPDSQSTPGAADAARRLAQLVSSKFNDVSPEEASVKRRRLAAAARRKHAAQNQQQRAAQPPNPARQLAVDEHGLFDDVNEHEEEPPQQQQQQQYVEAVRRSAPIFVPTLAADVSFISTGGAVVTRIPMGSPLEMSGVRVGDRIIMVDGRPLLTEADQQWLVKRSPDEPPSQPHDGDDDIFGTGDEAPKLHTLVHQDELQIAVIPAKKARLHAASSGFESFDEMLGNAVTLGLPMSPPIRKQSRPASLSPRPSPHSVTRR